MCKYISYSPNRLDQNKNKNKNKHENIYTRDSITLSNICEAAH